MMRKHLPLLGVMLLALTMRMNRIRQPLIDAYSWREASTAMMAENFYRHSWNIFLPAVSWTGPEPGYQGREFQITTYLAALCYTVLGQHDWIGRGISVLFGTWSVAALYLLTRRVWDEPRALVTALIQAVLPGAVFIDRSFLPDPSMLALTLTACWMLVVHLQTTRRIWLIGAIAFGSLAILAKLPSLAALPAVIYLIWKYPARLRAIGLLMLTLIPSIAYYIWAVYVGRHYPPYHIAGESNWIWHHGLGHLLQHGYYIPETAREFGHRLWTIPAVILMFFGLMRPLRPLDAAQPPIPARWFFHFWIFGCVILFVIGVKELTQNPWNFHVFSVACSTFAANGLVWFTFLITSPAKPHLRVIPVAVVGLILLGTSLATLRGLYDRLQGYANYQMGCALRELSGDDDLVVTLAADIGDPIPNYYSRRRGWIFPPAHLPELHPQWTQFPEDETTSIALFDDVLKRGATWIGIVAAPMDNHAPKWNFWDKQPRLVEYLKQTCEIVQKTPGYAIYRLKIIQRDHSASPQRSYISQP